MRPLCSRLRTNKLTTCVFITLSLLRLGIRDGRERAIHTGCTVIHPCELMFTATSNTRLVLVCIQFVAQRLQPLCEASRDTIWATKRSASGALPNSSQHSAVRRPFQPKPCECLFIRFILRKLGGTFTTFRRRQEASASPG